MACFQRKQAKRRLQRKQLKASFKDSTDKIGQQEERTRLAWLGLAGGGLEWVGLLSKKVQVGEHAFFERMPSEEKVFGSRQKNIKGILD